MTLELFVVINIVASIFSFIVFNLAWYNKFHELTVEEMLLHFIMSIFGILSAIVASIILLSMSGSLGFLDKQIFPRPAKTNPIEELKNVEQHLERKFMVVNELLHRMDDRITKLESKKRKK